MALINLVKQLLECLLRLPTFAEKFQSFCLVLGGIGEEGEEGRNELGEVLRGDRSGWGCDSATFQHLLHPLTHLLLSQPRCNALVNLSFAENLSLTRTIFSCFFSRDFLATQRIILLAADHLLLPL